jgi:FKBP-type peptidyl-prolyl cis-trans isomerase FkpA
MKYLNYLIILLSFLLAQCKKKSATAADEICKSIFSNSVAPANEIASVENYILNAGITATKHPRGFYYTIIKPGSGDSITSPCTRLKVTYKGTLYTGQIFEERTIPIEFQLDEVIQGWQTGLPFIKRGGKIKLIIPPSLGYGNKPVNSIPANSILIFDVDLIDFF